MGKLDLNSAEFEKEDLASGDSETRITLPAPVEIIPAVPLKRGLDLIPAQAGAPIPVPGGLGSMAILSIVDRALATISEISRCVTSVAMEKQRTKQVRIQTEAQIEAYKQETKRVQIQQKEETRRVVAECKKELELKRIELKQFRENIQLQDAQRRDSHQTYMASLDYLGKGIAALISQSDDLCKMLLKEGDPEATQTVLQSLDKVNARLVELSSEIVKLRQG